MGFLETAALITGIIQPIWKGVSSLHDVLINRDSLLNAYRYEVRANCNLLQKVNFDALTHVKISSPEFRNLVMCLQTQVGSSILYDASNKNYNEFKASIENTGINLPIENETDEDDKDPVKKLLEAITFSVDKIEGLKLLVACAIDGESLLKGFNLKVRMKNIHESFKIIIKALPEK